MAAEHAEAVRAGQEYRLGRLQDFSSHTISTVEVNGRKIGVLRQGDRAYAFANKCPHHGAPMCSGKVVGTMLPSEPDQYTFGLEGLVVRCPWHAYEFNVQTGESVGGIIQSRLFIYQTEVRGDDVFCRITRAANAPAA